MSGDVQPRKRKDKKKRKDEQIEETVAQPQPPSTPILPNDDTNIHVHKERSLGGGVCAKCVFFLLMIVISVVIGFTITDYRGQTDVEIPEAESRFASIFEGWTETAPDDDHDALHSEEVSHEEESDESHHDDDDDHDDSDDREEEVEEVEETEEEEEEEEPSDEDRPSDEVEDDEEEETEEISESQQEEEDEEDESREVTDEDEDNQIESEAEEEDIPAEEESEDEAVASEEINQPEEDVSDEKDDQDQEKVEEEIEEENVETTTVNSIKKTGSEAESESDNERSGAQNVYDFQNITNAEDYVYKEDLDEAQRHLSNNIQVGLSIFIKFLENHPNSPRALYGKAEALDLLADKKRSNEILQESIQSYLNVINAEDVPPVLFVKAAERCINRMRFIGNYGRAISVHKKLIQRFPAESKYKNDLAVTYLTINRISEARSLLIDILDQFPNDGFALVHYGFIVKTVDNDLNKAIDYLKRGIETREHGVIDGRFYFHLGDAFARLGKNDEAMQVYEDGVLNKVFLSKYQRSLYNVDRLTGRPWWAKEETPYSRLYEQLERNYHRIKEEGLSVLNQKGYFKDESENLRDVGDWKQFELYARGVKHAENCKKCPLTCKIIDSEPDVKGCRRGQVKFSVMHPGTHVWPHCGPTNCRLRIHLGLKVPEKTYIRVGEETRSWEEGKIFIFDDSFEHEVWHNGTEFRLVLIVDVWHPELTKNEKYNLSAI